MIEWTGLFDAKISCPFPCAVQVSAACWYRQCCLLLYMYNNTPIAQHSAPHEYCPSSHASRCPRYHSNTDPSHLIGSWIYRMQGLIRPRICVKNFLIGNLNGITLLEGHMLSGGTIKQQCVLKRIPTTKLLAVCLLNSQ